MGLDVGTAATAAAEDEEKILSREKRHSKESRAATMMLLENNCNPITLSFFENLKALKNLYSHFMLAFILFPFFSLSVAQSLLLAILPLMFRIPLDLCICAWQRIPSLADSQSY